MNAPTIFRIAAIFNATIGLVLVFGRLTLGPLAGLDPALGTNALVAVLCGCLIASFGGLYWMIADDPARYRPLMLLGAAAKASAVLAALWFIARGGNPRAPALALGDLGFIVLFLRCYARGSAGPWAKTNPTR